MATASPHHETQNLHRATTKVRSITRRDRANIDMSSWRAMKVTAALRHDGARWSETDSTTEMLQGRTELVQSFNRLLTVLDPHI